KIAQIVVHSDYSTQIAKQDLALVKVEKPFNFTEGKVKNISLSDDEWPSKGERTCTIAGFGLTENKTSGELRFLQVK
ncbi:trypsin-like serine protease, partial [bacterium LRH843]|nr:trypsin-like serine protease [bacterium LRH843]